MAKKLGSVIGVDIGSQQIKVAEIKMQGKQPAITALGVAPTPVGAVDHTGIFNADAVGQAIKQAIKNAGASLPQIVVSLVGQSSVLVRTLEVPANTEEELREQMQWEINRNIPFTESNIVSDYRPIPNGAHNGNMTVVMAIAPQSAVDTMLACAKKAGKSIGAIDVEPLGIARALKANYGDQFAGKTVCVVEIGHKTSSINIYKDDYLMMPRQVLLGGELFTQEIAREYGTDEVQAEEIKKSKVDLAGFSAAPAPAFGMADTTQFTAYNPFADDAAPAADVFGAAAGDEAEPAPAPVVDDSDRGRTYRAMQNLLEEIVSEVRRSIDYYRSRGDEVDQILLCGGGANLKGLASYMGESLGMPCDTFDAARRLNVSAKRLPAGFMDEHRAEFAVAIGNGLHALID